MLFGPSLYGHKASVSAIAISVALFASTANAQDVTISDDRTATVSSTNEIGTGSGTLTLDTDSSVTVSSGSAVIVDGPHNLVQTGAITSEDLAAGRGLFVDASAAAIDADLQLDGVLIVGDATDSFDPTLATDNVGLLVDGAFGYVGDIDITSNADIDVFGADARGIWLKSDVTGNLTNDGLLTVEGDGSVGIQLDGDMTGDFVNTGSVHARTMSGRGIYINGELDGAFIQRGSIQAGQTSVTETDGTVTDAEAGIAAVHVTNNITGGMLFDGIGAENDLDLDGDDVNDITADSVITTAGGTPALLIQNTGSTDLTIGTVDGLDYGIVHRGTMQINGTTLGLEAHGITLEGASATAQTIIEGGIDFDTGSLSVEAGDADATGLTIGDYSTVSIFNNGGTIDVDSRRSSVTDTDGNITYGPGGDATGILISENGSLSEIVSAGNILVTAQGLGGQAIAIQDLSGSLTSLTNSGSLLVQQSDTTTSEAIALDVRANTSGFALENSGDMLGDIRLGSGSDTVTLTGGNLTGDIYFGAGNDTLSLSNNAEFIGSLDFDGTLGLNVTNSTLALGDTDSLHVSTANFTGDSTVTFRVDPRNNEAGSIIIDGALTASSSVSVQPILENFATEAQSYNLITAGNITFADAASSLALTDTPYLFDVSLEQVDGAGSSTVTLSINPKSAADLDVAVPLTALYNNMITSSVALDIELERNLAGLTSKETVEDALASMLPDITNSSFNAAMMNKRQLENILANRLGDFSFDETFVGGGWAREITTYGEIESSVPQLNGKMLSVGLGFGYDFPLNDHMALGVSTGFMLNGVNGVKPVDAQFSSFAPYLSFYGMAKTGGLYIGVQATGQYVGIERERLMAFGDLERLVTSDTSGWNLAAMAEAGYDLNLGGINFKPFGRISAQSYSEGGYVEIGGDSANFDVSKRSFTRTEATFGASLGYDFKWERSRFDTSIIRPEVFYSYSKTLNGVDAESIEAIFVGGDASFLLEVDQMSETVEQMGGAFSLFSDGAKARIHYAREKLDDLSAHAVSINFALTF